MNKHITKKIILGIVCIISCLGLTGCGETIQQYATTHLPEAIQARATRNIEIAKEYHEIGAISTAMYDKCVANIQKQADRYSDTSKSKAMLSDISKSVVSIHLAGSGSPSTLRYVSDDEDETAMVLQWMGDGSTEAWQFNDVKDDGSDNWVTKVKNYNKDSKEDSLRFAVMSNYLAYEELTSVLEKTPSIDPAQDEVISIKEKSISPLVFIDNDVMTALNSMVKMELYVLKPDITTSSGANDLDGLMELVQGVASSDTTSTKTSAGTNAVATEQMVWDAKVNYLNNYFMPATDENNKPITLIDESDDSYDIVKVTEPNSSGQYRLGYDMWVAQDELSDCMVVRIQEFNEDALEKLKSYIGDKKYYIIPDSEGSWKAYLMEYPIDVIDSISLCERSDDWATDAGGYENVEVGLRKSGIGINLMTGQFVKYKHKNGKNFDWTDAEPIDITGEYYLTTHGAQNNDEKGVSSLVVKGVSEVSIKTTKRTITLNCGRIILRDYLEATFAPNYPDSSDEGNMVVFGRKIRFDMSNSNFHTDNDDKYKIGNAEVPQEVLIYERGTTVAQFVDVNGEYIPNSPTLEITDFCSFNTLQSSNFNSCTVHRLPYKNEETFTNTKTVDVDTPDITDLSVSNEIIKTVHPVTFFPSKDIGKVDYNADTKQKQRFYCIATTKGMFGSALFSSWVESTVPDANLDWWNEYLSENGFSYSVNHTDVMQYLTDNFKYQLSQNGVVILDLETIGKIQNMYDEEANIKRVGTIKTAFVIIGWTLIVGSFLIMLLWAIDTNTDIGLGLLEKLTFGNWIAVKYEEDIPNHNVDNRKYITFKGILIKTMMLIAIGILLIKVDIFWILTVIVDLFGSLASWGDKIIHGRAG